MYGAANMRVGLHVCAADTMVCSSREYTPTQSDTRSQTPATAVRHPPPQSDTRHSAIINQPREASMQHAACIEQGLKSVVPSCHMHKGMSHLVRSISYSACTYYHDERHVPTSPHTRLAGSHRAMAVAAPTSPLGALVLHSREPPSHKQPRLDRRALAASGVVLQYMTGMFVHRQAL